MPPSQVVRSQSIGHHSADLTFSNSAAPLPLSRLGLADVGSSPFQPFEITKWEVWEAYRPVKANRGAPGVMGGIPEVFEIGQMH